MSKNKSKKKEKSDKKEIVIKHCVFGDYQQKNKDLIKNYATTPEELDKVEEEKIEIVKTFENEEMRLVFYPINDVDDKLVSIVQETYCIFILFDMGERLSFDNLLDKWLIWLRDTCKYEGKIYILGDYAIQENDNPDFFLATSNDEVDEVIQCAELKANTTFTKIGELNAEQRRKKIDEQILNSKPKQTASKAADNEGGSLKDCIVF